MHREKRITNVFLVWDVYKHCISCTQEIQSISELIFRTENNTAGKKRSCFPPAVFFMLTINRSGQKSVDSCQIKNRQCTSEFVLSREQEFPDADIVEVPRSADKWRFVSILLGILFLVDVLF